MYDENLIFDFETSVKGKLTKVQLRAEAPLALDDTVLTLQIEVSEGGLRLSLTRIEVNLMSGSCMIHDLHSLSVDEICLAGCAVVGVIGPLITCFNKDPKAYLACLKAKGMEIGAEVVECAVGCA